MLDTTNLNAPAAWQDLAKATADIGFTIASDLLTGSLLSSLAASKPGGSLLELGTGTGMGTAWILAGMDPTARLTTVDRNEQTTAIARRYLGHDQRLSFQVTDGAAFILSCPPASADFIFADTQPGKFKLLPETLALLKPGGLYLIDDLLPQPSWEEGHELKVQQLITTLEQRPDLHLTKLHWSTGLIIAVKR